MDPGTYCPEALIHQYLSAMFSAAPTRIKIFVASEDSKSYSGHQTIIQESRIRHQQGHILLGSMRLKTGRVLRFINMRIKGCSTVVPVGEPVNSGDRLSVDSGSQPDHGMEWDGP
jgi:hypothetical protein